MNNKPMKITKRTSKPARWIAVLTLAFAVQIVNTPISRADNLNMKDANIRVLIEAVSRITGKTFVLDPRINNQKVTILSPANVDLSKDEVYQIFLSALALNQSSIVCLKTSSPSGHWLTLCPCGSLPKSNICFQSVRFLVSSWSK